MMLLASLALAASLSPLSNAPRLSVDRDLLDDVADVLAREQTSLAPSLLAAYGPEVASQKAGKSIGIGLQVGTPTALTLKFPGSGNADIVLGIGVGLGYENFGRSFGLSLHGDYLFTLASLVNNGTIDLSAYIGPGLWLTFFDRGYGYFGNYYYAGINYVGLGVRVPLGLAMSFATAPIEIYLELDPAIFVFPGIGGFLGASLGFRWFF
jgi:hypothetical protein